MPLPSYLSFGFVRLASFCSSILRFLALPCTAPYAAACHPAVLPLLHWAVAVDVCWDRWTPLAAALPGLFGFMARTKQLNRRQHDAAAERGLGGHGGVGSQLRLLCRLPEALRLALVYRRSSPTSIRTTDNTANLPVAGTRSRSDIVHCCMGYHFCATCPHSRRYTWRRLPATCHATGQYYTCQAFFPPDMARYPSAMPAYLRRSSPYARGCLRRFFSNQWFMGGLLVLLPGTDISWQRGLAGVVDACG